jgi:ribonucleotide reductase alpha subunit
VGDCYNDEVAAETSEESTEVTNVAGLPCTEPHDNEVYPVFNTTLTEFPGAEEMFHQSFEECLGRFDNFVGTKYEDSQLDITVMYPTSESWIELADREIICVLYDLDLVKLEGVMRDSKI